MVKGWGSPDPVAAVVVAAVVVVQEQGFYAVVV